MYTGCNGYETKLTRPTGNVNDYFGVSISGTNDTVVVGAWASDTVALDAGSAFIFTRSTMNGNTTWIPHTELNATGQQGGDFFGLCVGISGDTIVVGAYRHYNQAVRTGSAYIFIRDILTGVWTQEAELFASNGAADDYFGYSCGISGDTVVVGAWQYSGKKGAAYTYVRSKNGSWTEQGILLASDGATNDYFGRVVAVSGDLVVVGDRNHGDNGMCFC